MAQTPTVHETALRTRRRTSRNYWISLVRPGRFALCLWRSWRWCICFTRYGHGISRANL